MSLEFKVKQIFENFDSSSCTEFLDVLNQIQKKFHSPITQDYLRGKLKTISETSDEVERKKLCKSLLPYLDWYLQGL